MAICDVARSLFRRKKLSNEEIQATIDRSIEHMHRIRSPEAPNVMHNYHSFICQYSLEHPEASPLEAHEACMKAHPEYWPRTLPQKY